MKHYNQPMTEIGEWLGGQNILAVSGPFAGVDENEGGTKPVSSARVPRL